MSKKKNKPRPRSRAKLPPEKPQWGPPIRVGTIGSRVVEVREPINAAAIASLDEEQAVLLVVASLLNRLEVTVQQIQRDLDVNRRLSRIEAALAVSSDED